MELDTATSEMNMSNSNIENINGNNNNNIVVADSNGSSNGLGSIGDLMTSSQDSFRLKSTYDTDVVRLIGQHLISLGLKQTVNLLLQESGLKGLDHPVASRFQQYVLDGEWEKAHSMTEELVQFSEGDKKANIQEMKLLISEQKFLEAIEDNQLVKALKCLRFEITPMTDDTRRIQHLARLLICKSIEEVRMRANWVGKGAQSRQNLVEKFVRFIPPLIMLPPKRLNRLLTQAVQLQREQCTLHLNKNETEQVDLKTDHVCSSGFPIHSRQELDNHKTEVWLCRFSNDGTKLATAGLGGKIKIWDVDHEATKLTERCTFDCNSHSITCLSWSPNDIHLLACGSEDRPDLWIWNVHKEEVHNTINHTDVESTTTCSWHPSGEKFAAASVKGNFHIYDLDGNSTAQRDGLRVQCLSFLHKDPNIILAADALHRIKSYAIKDMCLETEEDDVLEERNPIMSFTVDRDDRYIAVNILEQGVHLWDFRLKTLLRMFPGVCQRYFTIHSSFSSPDLGFLASGSEDGKVFIYHVHKDQPVAIIHGHLKSVNCVSWNPKYPELLVSVSDDRTIRLWGPAVAKRPEEGKDKEGN